MFVAAESFTGSVSTGIFTHFKNAAPGLAGGFDYVPPAFSDVRILWTAGGKVHNDD